jgi:hypothetical protein
MPYIDNRGFWPDNGQELNLGATDTGARNWDSGEGPAAIAHRELKFRTMLRWYAEINSTVWNFEFVAYKSRILT